MGVLAEYVRKEADHLRAEAARRMEMLDEWLAAVSKLYEQLEKWIREADGELGILSFNRSQTQDSISEPRLGNYVASQVHVNFGGDWKPPCDRCSQGSVCFGSDSTCRP